MKKRLLSIMTAIAVLPGSAAFPAFAEENTSDSSLWDKFIKYDLCIADYDALTDEQKELCEFIFDTEQASNRNVICERARRILAGDDVGERVTLEKLDGAYGIWDNHLADKSGWQCYIDCVPDIIQLNSDYSRIAEYGVSENQYWLDDSGETYVSFHAQDDVDDTSRFDIYKKGEDEPIQKIACIQNDTPYRDYRCDAEYWNKDGLIEKNGGLYYIKPDNTAVFVWCEFGLSEAKEAVTEPFTIESEINGCPVTAVEGGAFTASPFTEIVIPDTVDVIDSLAFSNCEFLEKVSLPKNLSYLGYAAFLGCTSLEGMTIDCPELTLPENAFNGCINLKSIDLNVREIGETPFPQELESVKLGNSVEKIGYGAFYNCQNLKTLDIPRSVKYIGQDAFTYSGIKSINIPPSSEIIGVGTLPRKEGQDSGISMPNPKANPLESAEKCAFDSDCVINGYKGTNAERYAKEWNLEFVQLEAETGDVNLDGKIGIADAVSLQRGVLGKYVSTGTYYGDMNHDDDVNSFDMVLMRKRLLAE